MKIFSTLISSMKVKVMSLWTKIRLWTSFTFWQTKGITKLRDLFNKLLNVNPRHKKDYYPVFRWLVSKRLAFALVVVLGLLGSYYLYNMIPAKGTGSDGKASGVRTYRYNAVPLKFYDGTVQILAKNRHIAYIGSVKDGATLGQGSLYRGDGSLVYQGEFKNNRYNGVGRLYNQDSILKYEGEFLDNVYNGKGTYYRDNGVMEYSGDFLAGLRSGLGTMFNSGANSIFTGNFQSDNLLYSEFVGKKTSEVPQMYMGESSIYSSSNEYCVQMKEINAVYSVNDGKNSLETDGIVETIIVLDKKFPISGKNILTINELTACLGKPDYIGTTDIILPEAVAINQLGADSPVGNVEISKTQSFDNVYSVLDYNQDIKLYIYVYKSNGLTYTFYCDNSTSNFFMYSITKS